MVRLRCDPWLEPIYRLQLLMSAEPHIRSPFPERLDTIIPHSRGHRARDGGSILYFGISQPLFATVRPPESNAADQAARWLSSRVPNEFAADSALEGDGFERSVPDRSLSGMQIGFRGER